MKVCAACNEFKPLDAYGWKTNGYGKKYREARCKPCRAARNTRLNQLKREEEEMKTYEETVCPCDNCASQTSCKVECLSFRTWEKHGV